LFLILGFPTARQALPRRTVTPPYPVVLFGLRVSQHEYPQDTGGAYPSRFRYCRRYRALCLDACHPATIDIAIDSDLDCGRVGPGAASSRGFAMFGASIDAVASLSGLFEIAAGHPYTVVA